MAKYPLYFVPKVCVKNRVHDKQLTQTGKALFRKDCLSMSDYLIPRFTELSTKADNFIFAYILYNAKYGNREVVKRSLKAAKPKKLIGAKIVKVRAIEAYGMVRPAIRRIYYKLVKRTKTQ